MAASKFVTAASLTHCRPLTCAATAVSSYSSRLVAYPPDLIKWVRREGGFVHQAVKISQDESNGLGLVASQPIAKGSQLIALPDHIPLKFGASSRMDAAGDDVAASVLANLARPVPEELWAMKLGLKLLQERAKAGSFWWPYIGNLPEAYTLPIFFPGEDIKNLQYAPLLHQVNKRCRFLLEFEQLVKRTLETLRPSDHPFSGQSIDASSLGWAMSAVSSRAFRLHGEKLPGGGHEVVPMMLPLIDMCNHSFNPNARIVQEQGSGDQSMLITVTIGGKELVEDRLMAALRVMLASERQAVEKHDLSTLKSMTSDAPLGTANEVAALRTVIALCVIALGHFPTKMMEDESILKKGGVSSTGELAIQFRIQKKSMIIDVMRDLTRKVKLLLSKNMAS
ncbi:Actin-histidine N-methyltransferase [Linum perenne]